MALVGYARVSSVGQNLDVQLEKLQHCAKIFQEKKSGTSLKRPGLQACLEYVREGDSLVITRIDRLARSTFDLCHIMKTLEHKAVDLKVLDQNWDTSGATGRLLFSIMGAIAQFETEIRFERQIDGIHKAKARGVRFGQQKKLKDGDIVVLQEKRAQGVLIKELMAEYRLSKASVYRYLNASMD